MKLLFIIFLQQITMVLIPRIDTTITAHYTDRGRGRGKSSNNFRKSFISRLKLAIYYIQLMLLPMFSILGSQVKESQDHRARKEEENTAPKPLILQMKAGLENFMMCPGHTSFNTPWTELLPPQASWG